MYKITSKEFLLRQPSYPEVAETAPAYLEVANGMLSRTFKTEFAGKIPEGLLKRICLTLTDYLQDIVADGGLWRSFVDANMMLYGWKVPFHEVGDNYVDYELNREDVRFLVWYVTVMLSEENRYLYPLDKQLIEFADICFDTLEEVYEDAPEPEDWHLARGLEFNDTQDHKAIYELGNWLFLHSYLLTPAFALTLQEIISSVNTQDPDAHKKINELLEEAMIENTTGPLALFTPEWVYLMIERKFPAEKGNGQPAEIHKFYKKFTEYTGGESIKFFGSYEEMNRFFIEALGWAEGEEHLSQAKGAHDYVLMVTPYKGMLMARDIARCIKAPQNPLYDKDYASKYAFSLLTDRGLCPGDLLHRIFEENWLPDAKFPDAEVPEDDNHRLVAKYKDFIARCYLQLYYRGD
jgi:hypothetical protein